MKNIYTLLILLFSFNAFAQTEIDFYTSMGDFRVQVREDLMPITAGNFIDLVEEQFYDSVIFHRVVEDFVIQGGDPTGTGSGGPGYTILDEYHPDMNHDSTGVIAMAKTSQPNSAGSQFYFTLGAQNFLDESYAVFGTCIQNVEVIEAIGLVEVNGNDRPLVDVVMDSLRIVEGTQTGINDLKYTVLSEVYPNPFTESLTISYKIETPGNVDIAIYNIQGRMVQNIRSGENTSGVHSILWDGKNSANSDVAPGTYFLHIKTEYGVGIKKLMKVN